MPAHEVVGTWSAGQAIVSIATEEHVGSRTALGRVLPVLAEELVASVILV